MDELQNYLSRTKEMREKSKKIAKTIVENSNVYASDSKMKYRKRIETSFPGLSPKRFQEFEENLAEKIKEIYNPGHYSFGLDNTKSLRIRNKEDVYKLIYLNKSLSRKRKPKILIPGKKEKIEKIRNSALIGGKLLSVGVKSPINLGSKTTKSEESRSKSELKKLYLMPIIKKKLEE